MGSYRATMRRQSRRAGLTANRGPDRMMYSPQRQRTAAADAGEVIERQSGQRPEEILADSGYCSEKNLEGLESAGQPEQRIEGYIATERQKHDEYREACPKGPLPGRSDAG